LLFFMIAVAVVVYVLCVVAVVVAVAIYVFVVFVRVAMVVWFRSNKMSGNRVGAIRSSIGQPRQAVSGYMLTTCLSETNIYRLIIILMMQGTPR
jgi:hypothetical protein